MIVLSIVGNGVKFEVVFYIVVFYVFALYNMAI